MYLKDRLPLMRMALRLGAWDVKYRCLIDSALGRGKSPASGRAVFSSSGFILQPVSSVFEQGLRAARADWASGFGGEGGEVMGCTHYPDGWSQGTRWSGRGSGILVPIHDDETIMDGAPERRGRQEKNRKSTGEPPARLETILLRCSASGNRK